MEPRLVLKSFALLAVLLAVGCSSDSDDSSSEQPSPVVLENTPGKITLDQQGREAADKSNGFAFSMARAMSLHQPEGFIVSPMSVECVLGLLGNGTTGTAREEILNALGYGGNRAGLQQMDRFFANVLLNAPGVDERVELSASSILAGNSARGVAFSEDYADRMRQCYAARVEYMPFDSPHALDRINRWCSDDTRGLIGQILSEQEFNASALAYLLNTVYCQAPWSLPFDTRLTTMEPFTLADGTKSERMMMRGCTEAFYMSEQGMEAVSLSFGKGLYRMVVMMPTGEDSLNVDKLLESLTVERWQAVRQSMERCVVSVTLPLFETDSEVDLIGLLRQMGVSTAFAANSVRKARPLPST